MFKVAVKYQDISVFGTKLHTWRILKRLGFSFQRI